MNIRTPAETIVPTKATERRGIPVIWSKALVNTGIRYTAIVTPIIPSTNPFVYALISAILYHLVNICLNCL